MSESEQKGEKMPSLDSLTTSLTQFLADKDPIETEEGETVRASIIAEIRETFKQFVKSFGNGEGSDMDLLCVGPQFVTRHAFFEGMASLLKPKQDITEFIMITDAHVPLLAFRFKGIEIDLAYARIMKSTIPDDFDVSDNKILDGLDERCLRSLNGPRMALDILSLIPNPTQFRIVVRFIKHWAYQRGIYASSCGFLGGVACVIGAVKACQQCPIDANPVQVLQKYFTTMYTWDWSVPFTITPLQESPDFWDPTTDYAGRRHTMLIMTPSFPSVCCTSNVGASSLAIMQKEFKSGIKRIQEVMSGTRGWDYVTESANVFSMYKLYLRIVCWSETKESQLVWSGCIRSQLRKLAARLEINPVIQIVHPIPQSFDNITLGTSNQTLASLGQPLTTQQCTTFYIGLQISGKSVNLSSPCGEFVQSLQSTEEFDDSCMGAFLGVVKRADIPAAILLGMLHGASTTCILGVKRKEREVEVGMCGFEFPEEIDGATAMANL
ncbi:polynucleotide adenylyltransferase [Rhizoclosmatium sp. JEL0117]|nr:polynucleotide adenylyltransferase [Rhizoclosmatium sp. JEL0117]